MRIKKTTTQFRYVLTLLGLPLCAVSFNAMAAGTVAGTVVKNTVQITYQVGDAPDAQYVDSASDAFVVSELIRTNVTTLDPQGVATATPAIDAVLSYQVTNTGNGQESFLLSTFASLSGQFTPDVTGLWIESNGQAGWQPDDTLYTGTSGGISLEPDESRLIYVVSDIPADVTDQAQSDVTLISTSATTGANSLMTGGSLPTGGNGGIEAVIAQDNAKHEDASFYTVSTVKLEVDKSIVEINDPYGGNLSMPGSEVTYQIRVVASGNGVANDFSVKDAVPVSMLYKNNSLKMNGSPVSDDIDSDSGHYDASDKVAYFTPGTITAPVTHEYTLTYIIE